jgi:enhancer of mRNA-decapping protein 4
VLINILTLFPGKSGGIVRVINRRTAERALLRGFTGRVVDIAFAHLSPIVLGTVDEIGNMFIYEVLEGPDGKIEYPLS